MADLLDTNGIWDFEQSYMPLMLSTNPYDTICLEHLEYYSLSHILWMAERGGLKIVDVELNAVNGRSFSVTAQKLRGHLGVSRAVQQIVDSERAQRLDDLQSYVAFGEPVRDSNILKARRPYATLKLLYPLPRVSFD